MIVIKCRQYHSISHFLDREFDFAINIEEYFQYHKPKTQVRIDRHNAVNEKILSVYETCKNRAMLNNEVEEIRTQLIDFAISVTENELCLQWAINVILKIDTYDVRDFLMKLQQIRMFLNQGITIDEILLLRGTPIEPQS
jgi:hypothetical protein